MSDLRDALNAAVESTREADEPTPEPVESAPVEAAPEPVEAVEAAPVEGKTRDEGGRFAAKAKAAPSAAVEPLSPTAKTPEGVAPAVAAPVAAVEPIKAPQSWSPAEREAWAGLPPAAQAAVHRREVEMATTLQGVAEAKRTHQQFADVVAPYRAILGSADPMGVARSYFETAAQLQTAPVPQKAAILARMIQNFGVPVEALAAALDGQPQPEQRAPQHQTDPRVDQLFARLEQHQQSQRQGVSQQAAQSVAEFQKGAEFMADVREDMADIIDLASRRGVELTLAQAYERAIKMHPEISKVMAQREAAKAAAASAATLAKSRAASSSVRSSPAPAVDGKSGNSIGDDIRASFAAHSGR